MLHQFRRKGVQKHSQQTFFLNSRGHKTCLEPNRVVGQKDVPLPLPLVRVNHRQRDSFHREDNAPDYLTGLTHLRYTKIAPSEHNRQRNRKINF